jgi:hypothetical protein
VGFADAIGNFGILWIGLKSPKTLPNQNLGYHDRKPNITELVIERCPNINFSKNISCIKRMDETASR